VIGVTEGCDESVPGPIICAHCIKTACKDSKWYCAEHPQKNREASRRTLRKAHPQHGQECDGFSWGAIDCVKGV